MGDQLQFAVCMADFPFPRGSLLLRHGTWQSYLACGLSVAHQSERIQTLKSIDNDPQSFNLGLRLLKAFDSPVRHGSLSHEGQ